MARCGFWWMAMVAGLSACRIQPASEAAWMPDAPRRLLHVTQGAGVQPMPAEGLGPRFKAVGATADVAEAERAPTLAMDGNPSTYWASGLQATGAALSLSFSTRRAFRWAMIKTGPLPEGVTFKFMVSDDGSQWTPASPRHKNTTWTMQVQEIMGEGKFLQVRFFNHDQGPPSRFKVHEIEVYGGADAVTPQGG